MSWDTAALHAAMPFTALLGATAVAVSARTRCGCGSTWDAERCTAGGVLHGGALMGLADAAGGLCAFLNLPDGASGTATISSATNFLRGVRGRARRGGGTAVPGRAHGGRGRDRGAGRGRSRRRQGHPDAGCTAVLIGAVIGRHDLLVRPQVAAADGRPPAGDVQGARQTRPHAPRRPWRPPGPRARGPSRCRAPRWPPRAAAPSSAATRRVAAAVSSARATGSRSSVPGSTEVRAT